MFEITSVSAKDKADIELNKANGEPLCDTEGNRLSVTVWGPGSKAYAAAQAARQQRLLDRSARKGRNARMTPEEAARENAEFLAACTVSFNGWAYQGKADAQAFVAAYSDPALGWLSDQVGAGVSDWANFSSGSAQS
jgi:hypothetical protein